MVEITLTHWLIGLPLGLVTGLLLHRLLDRTIFRDKAARHGR